MRFDGCRIPGVYQILAEPKTDGRGFFARVFCSQEFSTKGLAATYVQSSVSFNLLRGTIRGMHFQNAPDQEVKLVRCIRGAAFDVVIDLRPDSPAYKKWVAFEISDNNRSTIYIPAGCAHGFQALTNDMELEYHMSSPYCPEAARGVRWNDNAFSIAWPIPHPIMSERDAAFPDFQA